MILGIRKLNDPNPLLFPPSDEEGKELSRGEAMRRGAGSLLSSCFLKSQPPAALGRALPQKDLWDGDKNDNLRDACIRFTNCL